MGLIRKTLSISTLGIVDFRSKKELLRRAEKAQRAAQAQLIGEQAARATADKRIAAAERRARQAELLALQQAKRAEAAKAQRRRQRRRSAHSVLEALESATGPIEDRARDLGRRGRKVAAKAGKRADAAAEQARKRARKEAKRGRAKLDEVSGAAADLLREHR